MKGRARISCEGVGGKRLFLVVAGVSFYPWGFVDCFAAFVFAASETQKGGFLITPRDILGGHKEPQGRGQGWSWDLGMWRQVTPLFCCGGGWLVCFVNDA